MGFHHVSTEVYYDEEYEGINSLRICNGGEDSRCGDKHDFATSGRSSNGSRGTVLTLGHAASAGPPQLPRLSDDWALLTILTSLYSSDVLALSL